MLIVLLFVLLLFSLYALFFSQLTFKVKLGIVALVSSVITYYIRVGFGRYYTTIDESYYISLIGNPVWYKASIVSGFVVPFILQLIKTTLNIDPASLIVYYSVAFAILYVGIIYWVYRKVGVPKNYSIISLAVLFVSSFYIWSFIQIRPQQLGILVGISIVSLFISMKPSRMFFVTMSVLFILLIFTHIFSFILFSMLLVMYLVLLFIRFGPSKEIFKKFLGISLAILISWLAFLFFPYSGRTVHTLVWIVNSILPFHDFQILLKYFPLLSTVAYVLLMLLIYYAGKFLYKRYFDTLMNFWQFFRDLSVKYSTEILFLTLILLVVGFYLQFKLGANIYTKTYRNSIITLVFFQLGNIFFGFMFMRGILDKLKENTLTEFDIMAIIWIFIGTIMLFISFFMPKGNAIWGFSNWMIRVAQYFVIFASPTVAYAVYKDIKAMRLSHLKLTIPLLISVLIVISIINTARPPQIYDYEIVWSNEMVEVAKEVRVSNTLMFRYNASPYLKFAMGNLLKAYGKPVEITRGSNIVLSSDNLYVYSSNYHPLPLSVFSKKRGPIVAILGTSNLKVRRYFMNLLNKVFPALILGDMDNCNMYIKQGYPVIIVGGKLANKCTALLEKEKMVLVYMGKDYVITQYATYSIPTYKKDWWDIDQGLFVIQAVEYRGAQILIIEGTNVDATVAGVWYYIKSIHPNLDEYKDFSYVVGKWIEKDNNVLSELKFDSNDNNGFSYKDEIILVEMG